MSLNLVQKRQLSDLRSAADSRDAEQTQYVLKQLLGQLEYYAALALTLEVVHRFLDLFESYEPEETWVRSLIIQMASYGMAPSDQQAEAAVLARHEGPGIANYMKAVFDVTQSMQPRHTSEARLSFLASAIVNTVMAEVAEAWYGERIEAWERVRANVYDPQTQTYSDAEATQIVMAFWTDEGTVALERMSWYEIADRIEKALERQSARSGERHS
jgi:hypothetical protein